MTAEVVCICSWVGARLMGSNRAVFMNIISDSDQKINGMYNTTSQMPLFVHKSTDNQYVAAFWSLLRTVVHKSQRKQTPACPGPVPNPSDKFMGL